MARVVVIGGGYGGLASAARLAKLGHDVTLLEAAAALGGAVGFVEQDGFRWDAGPTSTLLPAVMRDLFRKSGRALEKEVELVPVEPVRQHRFPDDDVVMDLPGGSRGAQIGRRRRGVRRGPGRAGGRRTSRPSPTTGRRCAATGWSARTPTSTRASRPRHCSRPG